MNLTSEQQALVDSLNALHTWIEALERAVREIHPCAIGDHVVEFREQARERITELEALYVYSANVEEEQ